MDTLSECVAALAQRDISSRELTDEFLSRSIQANPVLNAYISIDADGARAAAAQADERRAAGESQPLLGVPIAHKDIFCTDGLLTTCGSRMLENFIAPYDATVVDRLRSAGAVTLGKTNMDEFAMGSSNESSYFGPVANPWDLERVPGGSSGGSAAAVAASLAPAATGTDTGGSIRQPAAFCGLTGLKPTYGRVSRYGMIAYASSLDQGGPMAWSAADCALLLATMAGHDAKDATSVAVPTQDYMADLNQPLSGLRIGLPREYYDGLDGAQVSQLAATRAIFEQAGATILDVSLPHTASAVAAYYVIAPAECSANLSRYDGVRYGHRCEHPQDLADLYARSRAEGFGNEVKRRILAGTYVLSVGYFDAYYRQAQRVRRLIRQDFLDAYASVDLLLTPTTPGPAFVRGELSDPLTMYQQDVYTVPASLAGMPAISFPVGMQAGLPIGAQLIGPHFSESRLLAAANQFQQQTDFHTNRPTTDFSGPHAGATR